MSIADEIIKLIEYITGNPIFIGVAIVCVVFFTVIVTMAFIIIAKVARSMSFNRHRW